MIKQYEWTWVGLSLKVYREGVQFDAGQNWEVGMLGIGMLGCWGLVNWGLGGWGLVNWELGEYMIGLQRRCASQLFTLIHSFLI
jgi:hypothetical protein